MRRFWLTFVVLAIAAALAPGASNAALISADDAIFGNDSITRDTASGLEWLDLAKSQDMTPGYVSAQLGSGGVFEGWRFATAAEVGTFFNNAGIPSEKFNQNSFEIGHAVFDLLALIGILDPTFFNLTIGFIADSAVIPSSAPDLGRSAAELHGQIFGPNAQGFASPNTGTGHKDDFHDIAYASFLVREATAVPEPATLVMLGFAIAAASALKRAGRRRSRPRSVAA